MSANLKVYSLLLCVTLCFGGMWLAPGCSTPPTSEEPSQENPPTTDDEPKTTDGGTSEKAPSDQTGFTQRYTMGSFQIEIEKTSFRILRSDGTVLLESPKIGTNTDKLQPGLVGWRTTTPKVTMNFGMFLFEEPDAPAWSMPDGLQVKQADTKQITLEAGDAQGTIALVNPHVLRVWWKLPAAKSNRVLQSFACAEKDRFFGLGAKVHGSEHRGEVMPAWVSEQGIDKIRRKDPTDGFPIKGDIHDAYLAVPYVLSNRGFGLLVEDSRRSVFHFCSKAAPDRWSVELWHNELKYLVINGPNPLDIVERLTAQTGRPRLLPKWALAPWMDALYGQQKVLEQAQKIRQEKIPSAVIWTEDWVGAFEDARGYHLNYQWIPDTTLYPDIKKLTGQLHGLGFKFFGYFNSFIKVDLPHWKEAHDKDYVIKDKDGKPIHFAGVFFKQNTLPDLSKPEVVTWIKGYMKAALQLGFDGWMADYGEWLPLNAKLHNGQSGWEAHNTYPVMWQKLNREIFDQERPNGDYVFFARSGWTGTGGLAPVVWAGDQQTEFGGGDGMRSVIPIAINSGISGIPVVTHEIAGYSSIGVPPSTKELFFRWTQLSAFSSIMRTHHGAMARQNWHWDKDKETIDMFRRYTRLHIAMFPYRYSVAKEASEKGWPMMRHLHLHYPNDDKVARIDDQFLLGAALLVAPVQQDKARKRDVYLPAGAWYHYFTGQRYEGQKSHTIDADITDIPVFAKAGAILPEFLEPIDTLATSTDSNVADIRKAEAGPLGVRVYLGDDGTFQMYDGTLFQLEHKLTPDAAPTIKVNDKEWPACQNNATENCTRSTGTNSLEVHVTDSQGFRLTGHKGSDTLFTLNVEKAPKARKFVVQVWW